MCFFIINSVFYLDFICNLLELGHNSAKLDLPIWNLESVFELYVYLTKYNEMNLVFLTHLPVF